MCPRLSPLVLKILHLPQQCSLQSGLFLTLSHIARHKVMCFNLKWPVEGQEVKQVLSSAFPLGIPRIEQMKTDVESG